MCKKNLYLFCIKEVSGVESIIKFVESRGGRFYLLFISKDASLIAPCIYYSYMIARDTIISTTNDRLVSTILVSTDRYWLPLYPETPWWRNPIGFAVISRAANLRRPGKSRRSNGIQRAAFSTGTESFPCIFSLVYLHRAAGLIENTRERVRIVQSHHECGH